MDVKRMVQGLNTRGDVTKAPVFVALLIDIVGPWRVGPDLQVHS